MSDNTAAETPVVNMYWRIAGSAQTVTPSEACRAGALGMQVAGLDEFGVISHALTDTADALDALREAVNGCGRHGGCGDRYSWGAWLCATCDKMRDAAINALLGEGGST